MTEPTVQVPVTLIKALDIALREGSLNPDINRRARAITALLSQPTPTAEPKPSLCAKMHPHEPHATTFRVWARDGYYDVPGTCPGVAIERVPSEQLWVGPQRQSHRPRRREPGAEPPRIEDLTPGTTFRFGKSDTLWTLYYNGTFENFYVVSPDGSVWQAEDIDPSTIRDVTPPAVTS